MSHPEVHPPPTPASEATPERSLASRTAVGVAWTSGAKAAETLLRLGISILLMRLLGPRAFGLIGMVMVFTGFAAVFSEAGFGSALVQRQHLREEHCSSAFWLLIVLGGAITLALVACAPVIAAFYDMPQLAPITAAIALVFVLEAPGIVPRALLQKQMQFKRLAGIQVAGLLLSGVTGVWLALVGAGVWALIVRQLVSTAVTAALGLLLVEWRPRFFCDRAAIRDLFGYGAGLTGFSFVNYWARRADDLLIGRFMGANALGLYSRAYELMLLPISQIISVVSPVLFPALVSIQDDRPSVRRIYLRAMRVITFVTFPMMLGLALVAKPFVLGVLGPEWSRAATLISILAVVGISQSLANPTGLIYTSQGRTDWMFRWGLFSSGVAVTAIVIGTILGSVESVAWAYLIANLAILYPCISIPGRLIGLRFSMVVRVVAGNLMAGLAMVAVVAGAQLALPRQTSPLATLVTSVIVGVASYAVISLVAGLKAVSEVKLMAHQAFTQR